jgi:formylmethanofuran dehydrogenase subunit E
MVGLSSVLERSASLHDHLCPRQVLGARMGLYARELLGVDETWGRNRLFVFVETDGCFADGISAATNCRLGHRTMRLQDHGKVGATFVDTDTQRAVRIVPHPRSRESASSYVPGAPNRWHAQRDGYQIMPTRELLQAVWVRLTVDMGQLIAEPGGRATCAHCGEEIVNRREVLGDGVVLCRHCAGCDTYFDEVESRGESDSLPAVAASMA